MFETLNFPFFPIMFCSKCQAFWQAFFLASKTCNSSDANSSTGWAHHEAVLHHSISELKASAKEECLICRTILSSPTQWEHRDLLADDHEALDIVLEIDAQNTAFPSLFVTINAGKVGRLPRRMLATCDGYLEDGRCICFPACRMISELLSQSS